MRMSAHSCDESCTDSSPLEGEVRRGVHKFFDFIYPSPSPSLKGRGIPLFCRLGLSDFVIVMVLLNSAHADDAPSTSLFFINDETKQIETLVAKILPKKSADDIHLGAVLYYGPDRWVVWLQGKRWTPETDSADMHVLAVQPGEVHLALVDVSDTAVLNITLKPHQTYQIATGKIVEGPH